jgi:hypothetical protein
VQFVLEKKAYGEVLKIELLKYCHYGKTDFCCFFSFFVETKSSLFTETNETLKQAI